MTFDVKFANQMAVSFTTAKLQLVKIDSFSYNLSYLFLSCLAIMDVAQQEC